MACGVGEQLAGVGETLECFVAVVDRDGLVCEFDAVSFDSFERGVEHRGVDFLVALSAKEGEGFAQRVELGNRHRQNQLVKGHSGAVRLRSSATFAQGPGIPRPSRPTGS